MGFSYNLQQVYLSNIQDIAIINQNHVSTSTYNGFATGRRGSRFMSGSSKSQGSVIGDLCFLIEGKPVLVLEGVNDPQSLKNLVSKISDEYNMWGWMDGWLICVLIITIIMFHFLVTFMSYLRKSTTKRQILINFSPL
jgi:hypothetical protein